MRAFKFEIGLLAMIKQPGLPAIWVMAFRTVITKPTLVLILVLMTLNTLNRRCSVILTEVTFFTGRHGMQANQGETSDVVFEEKLFSPALGVMTLITGLTHFSIVRIFMPVTAEAIGLQFSSEVATMAGFTLNLLVLTRQGKVGFLVMTEFRLTPLLG